MSFHNFYKGRDIFDYLHQQRYQNLLSFYDSHWAKYDRVLKEDYYDLILLAKSRQNHFEK